MDLGMRTPTARGWMTRVGFLTCPLKIWPHAVMKKRMPLRGWQAARSVRARKAGSRLRKAGSLTATLWSGLRRAAAARRMVRP